MIVNRTAGTALLALAAAACWWLWAVFDASPYAPWQVTGCVLCLLAVGVLGVRWLSAGIVVAVLPPAFTAAWAATAAAYDSSGLWVIGAVLVLVGTFAVTGVVAPLAALAMRMPRARRRLGTMGP